MNILQNIKKLLSTKDEKSDLVREYSLRIKNYFPTFLSTDVERVLSIMPLSDNIYVESFGKQYKLENAIHSEYVKIQLQNEVILLSGRLCFAEPDSELDVANLCSIESNLTSYVSRHSFATQAMLLDIPLNAISTMLGHSSLKTTQTYLASLPKNILDDYNEKLLNHISN